MTSIGEMFQATNPAINSDQFANPPIWQAEISSAIRTVAELGIRLEVEFESEADLAAAKFPVFVTESFLSRMQKGNPRDPLLLQVVPRIDENISIQAELSDPVGDRNSELVPGLLHKYLGRALMVVTGKCAIHCRYCFRKEFPYELSPKSLDDWQPAIEALQGDSTIREIILSGGDPLTLSDQRLGRLIKKLESVPHLDRLRIHSRLPIVLPSRVTERLIDVLTTTRLRSIFVVHANHGNELTRECPEALKRLVNSGIPVLNQAVLLKGINDSVEALAELCEKCINLGVMPYYLHQLDRVHGTSHFEVEISAGKQLICELRKHLPGYAVPKYVREVAGKASKLPLDLVASDS